MSASKIGLDPEFSRRLYGFEQKLAGKGIKVVMTWGFRSTEQQDELYAKGRTAPGSVVTKARGGYSWHNFGLAADYAFVVNGKVTWTGPWDVFGRIARLCGLEWGGDWKKMTDRPHVQMTKGKSLAQMRTLAKKKPTK